MTAIRNRSRKGFTLVEILIVVIILGILAAIVIPQFTNASQDARRSALASTVQSVRSQIELFKLQHGDTLPNLVGGTATDTSNWAPFTATTVYGTTTFGPYMQSAPENQLMANSSVVKNGTSVAATDTCGYVYDYGTNGAGSGKFWGVDKNTAGALSLLGD
jgi:general secretion pathway protein G